MSETAPTSTNSPESNIPENWELRDKDPAASLIDGARAFRESVYASGATPDQINSMFKSDGSGVAGAPELMNLIARMRDKGNSTLGSNEFAYTKHMQVEKNYHDAMGSVDWDKFAAKGKEASGDDTIHNGAAYREGYNWVIADLEQKLQTATDLTEQDSLEDKIELITKLRDIETTSLAHKSGPDTLEAKYVGTLVERDTASADKMDDYNAAMGGLKAELSDRDKQTNDVVAALRVLSEDYPDEFGRTAAPIDTLDDIPELEYVDPSAPATNPDIPADDLDTPPAPMTESARAKEIRLRKEEHELNSLRKQMAEYEAGGWMRGKMREALNPDAKSHDELKALYDAASTRRIQTEYGKDLSDPTIPADLKNFILAEAMAKEWAKKRDLQNEVLQNTPVAKIGRWIGKHKLLVTGAGFLLAPMTLGVSAGIGLAAAGGLIAASKIDAKTRGMKSIDVDASMDDLHRYMNEGGGRSYEAALAYMDKKDKRARTMEKVIRTGAVTLGGAAASGVAFNYFGSMPEFTSFLNSAPPTGKGIIAAILFGLWAKDSKKEKDSKKKAAAH